MTNRSYGTWHTNTNGMLSTLEATVEQALDNWPDIDQQQVCDAYRAAINEALPEGLMLCGDEFYGPADEPDEWDTHLRDKNGRLDIAAIIDGVGFWEIVEHLCAGMPSLDPVTHTVRPWGGQTWRSTTGKLDAKPGTYCASAGSHLFVASVCANCGLTTTGG